MKSFLVGLKNVLLWSHERGSWQYDVLCLLIVATIFIVPSHYFGDRDRLPVVRAKADPNLASKLGEKTQEIDAVELYTFLQKQNKIELMNSPREAMVLYLQDQLKREVFDLESESVTDSQGRIKYRVRFR